MKTTLSFLIILSVHLSSFAQTVSTIATGLGGGLAGIERDASGNVYVSEVSTHKVKKVTPAGVVTDYCTSGLNYPCQLAFDTQGNLYVASHLAGTVAKIPPGGGAATTYVTGLANPFALVQYDGDTIVVGEYFSQKIFKIWPGGGVAGSGTVPALQSISYGITGSSQRLTYIEVYPNKDLIAGVISSVERCYRMNRVNNAFTLLNGNMPYQVFDISKAANGNFYVGAYYYGENKLFHVNGTTGALTIVAGTGVAGSTDGPALTATLDDPYALQSDADGNVWFTEYDSGLVRKFKACDGMTVDVTASGSACIGGTVAVDATVTGGSHSWTYAWTAPDGSIPPTEDFSLNIISPNQWGTYELTVTDLLGCVGTGSINITGTCSIWTGSTDTDWNVGTNWSTGVVPTAIDTVVIPSAPSNQPHVTSAIATPAQCKNLHVLSGATLTVDAGKAMTVTGTTNNAGTFLVKADAVGIGSLITQGTIAGSGAFQMEQYLTGAGGATPNGVFYYVSSPTSGATSNAYSAAGTDKLWSADETTQSYSEITDNSTNLNVTEGYVARMGATGSITFDGTSFNTGSQSASGLTRTGNSATNRGYNLVGNPYPSTVSWDAATKTNLETTMWYRTHQGSTMLYDTYNATGQIGTNNNGNGMVTGSIAPTQAFWVKVDADGNTGQLDFTNAMRSHGTLAGIYRMVAEEGTVRMTLSNGTNSDEAILLFNENAQDAFDAYDSHKFWAAASVPQLYMHVAEDSLVINGLYSTATNPIVDLGVKLPTSGNYTLNANEITVVGETVHLEDRLLNIFQDLNVEPNYAFTSVAGNIGNRFALHFGMTAVGVDDAAAMNSRVYTSNGNTLNIILSENTENGKVDVMDMAGRIVGSFNLNTNRTSVNMNVSTGVYLVRIQTEKGMNTHKIILN